MICIHLPNAWRVNDWVARGPLMSIDPRPYPGDAFGFSETQHSNINTSKVTSPCRHLLFIIDS